MMNVYFHKMTIISVHVGDCLIARLLPHILPGVTQHNGGWRSATSDGLIARFVDSL